MISILSIAIVALLCVIVGHLVYLHLIRPVFVQRLQYRIFALRDDLRMLALTNDLADGAAAAYPVLERRLNVAVHAVWHIDLAELLYVRNDRAAELEFARTREIILSGDPRLAKIYRDCIKFLIVAVILNSPILFAIVPTAMLLEQSIDVAKRFSDSFRRRAWEATAEQQLAAAC